MEETQVRSLGQEDSLEKDMTTYSSITAWRIQWTEEPGGLQSVGSHRVRLKQLSTHANKPDSDEVQLRGFFKWSVHKPPPLYKVEKLAAEFAHSLSVQCHEGGIPES